MRRLGLVVAFLLACPAAAGAQDLNQAKAFVTGLYAAYAKTPGPEYVGRQAEAVFSPSMIDLMRREAAHTPKGEVGALDGDPICDCQDYEISAATVTVTMAAPGRARAAARFLNFGEARTATFDLVAVDGQWRVADIHSANLPSLVDLLQESLKAPAR